MSLKKGLLEGSNVSDSHSTMLPFMAIIIKVLKKEEYVKKLILGHINNASKRLRVRRIRVLQRPNKPVEVELIDDGGIQPLYVSGATVDQLNEVISNCKKLKQFHKE